MTFPEPNTYEALRRLFNPAISGTTVNSWLYGISIGDNYLRRNAKNLVDNLFVGTAVGEYLDILGNNIGVNRPNGVGISDEAFRKIVSTIPFKQNTTQSILNVLDIYFSPYQTRAYIETENSAPYLLQDGDNLIIEIDGSNTYEIVFDNDDFVAIGTASALEVANVISSKLHNLNSTAYAITYYNEVGNPLRVRLLSNTIGSRSVVRVVGGTAQKALRFNQFVDTTQNTTTEFTVENYTSGIDVGGTTARFTWTNGTSPSLSEVKAGDYVIISGTGWNSANKGSFTIDKVVNGPVDYSYFEITNNASYTQSVVLSTTKDIAFFRPIKRIVGSDLQYANVYELNDGTSKIFIPATTTVVARTPTTGGSYIADVFITLTHGAVTFTEGEIVIGSTSSAIGNVLSGSSGTTILGNVGGTFEVGETITGESSGYSSTIATITSALDDSVSGCYLIDLSSFMITSKSAILNTQLLQNHQYGVISVDSTEGFPDSGYLLINMGYDNEEQPVPYLKILNAQDILLDSSYMLKNTHFVDSSITLLKSKAMATPEGDGSDRGCYLTDIALARDSAVTLIDQIQSAGIGVSVEVLYPSDIGLGNAGLSTSDKYKVWGP